MTIDEKVVQEKLDKGEALSQEEEKWLLENEPGPEGVVALPTEAKAAEVVSEESKTEEATEETSAKEEEQKPTPEAASKKPEDKAPDFFERLERELVKPEGQEDLKDFTEREKAYYHQMRRDRKARQTAEIDRDKALFNVSKMKKETEKKPEETAPDPLDDLKKKDPTDFITVADALKMVEAVAKKPEERKDEVETKADPVRVRFLKMCEKEAREQHPDDFDAVMELTDDILLTNEKYLVEVAVAINAGENPAIRAYELIKADSEFAKLFPVAQTKIAARKSSSEKKEEKKDPPAKSAEEITKEKKASEAEAKLETNANKKKTTGHVESGVGGEGSNVSLEEYIKMSDADFAKLPKKTREALLRKYG